MNNENNLIPKGTYLKRIVLFYFIAYFICVFLFSIIATILTYLKFEMLPILIISLSVSLVFLLGLYYYKFSAFVRYVSKAGIPYAKNEWIIQFSYVINRANYLNKEIADLLNTKEDVKDLDTATKIDLKITDLISELEFSEKVVTAMLSESVPQRNKSYGLPKVLILQLLASINNFAYKFIEIPEIIKYLRRHNIKLSKDLLKLLLLK
jgi:hypothetical protein